MNSYSRFGAMCALPLVAVLAIAGCSNQSAAPISGGMMNSTSSEAPGMMADGAEDSSASDIAFAQMMIPHHQQAVEMSQLAPERASSSFIRKLAEQIQAAQQPEIDVMSGWLKSWGVPIMTMMESMNAHGGHGMAGIVSEPNMAKLTAAKGAIFDRLYAQLMIAHHQGAIAMAKAVEDSTNPAVAELARSIISAQQSEIQKMQGFLKN